MKARAIRWVDVEPFPGVVEVELTDALGKSWTFVDKSPIFDAEGVLTPSATYPLNLDIACTIIGRKAHRFLVSTASPWGIETVDGKSSFVLDPSQVVDLVTT